MFKSEILAPVSDFDMLHAAVRCGADAVYLGLKQLNARRNAGNFSNEELFEVTAYCHARNVRVYLTLNTLVADSELETAKEIIECACKAGVDALIVQDLGVVSLVKEVAPDMELHASTQMSVNTLSGVKMLEKLGFKRVVLPREISEQELKYIAENSKAELEVFVHGALCMCVSGQCYMSAMLGSRSGNRGLCAQPCRLPFASQGGTGHDLSLKDLSLFDYVKQMQNMGIASLKIEGRMKRPEYVAAAVTACKQARDETLSQENKDILQSVFSRSGFTDGYYKNKLGKNMFGTRQKEDVTAAKGVLSQLERLYDREQPKIAVEFALSVNEGEKATLSGRAGKALAFAESEGEVQKALNKPTTYEMLEKQLNKVGSTPFYIENIDIELEQGVSVPVSAINSLRREVLDELLKKLEKTEPIDFVDKAINFEPYKADNQRIFARFSNINQVPDNLKGIELVYVPLFSDIEKIKELSHRVKVAVEIPRGIFSSENRVKKALKQVKAEGIEICLANTLDAVAIARAEGFCVHTGHTLNLFNSYSLAFAKELGIENACVSAELTLDKIEALGTNIKRGIVSYGRLPLMLTRNCPVANGKKCDECKSRSTIKDRMNIEFPVRCSNGFSEILNSRPIYLADRLDEIKNVDYQILYFTIEGTKKCEKIIGEYINGSNAEGEFTRGLYYRGVE
ncbi:MAG: U32 family peptidase [Clostridiales bacterium]|nr:U32 family peptidase [Clostridiales bacterium]